MPQIYVCYIVYNEEDKIALSLHTIIEYVDKVIIVDGAFAQREHSNPQSTDKTKEISEKICGDKLIWVDCKKQDVNYVPWETESEKRNVYLRLVPEGAWFYIIDADVIVTGDVAGTFKMLKENDTINGGDVIGVVKMLNFYPVVTKNPEHFPLEPPNEEVKSSDWLGKIRKLTDWYVEDLETALDTGTLYSYINWIGWYQRPVMCLYKKFDGMEYRDFCARIYFDDEYFTSKIFYALPVGRKWSFIPNILHVNMKFLMGYKSYISMQNYKADQKRKERKKELEKIGKN
jgi:hypothetical protein